MELRKEYKDEQSVVIKGLLGHALLDNRLSKSHFNLYMAYCWIWVSRDYPEFLFLFSHEVMPIAKISSSATYVKTINELEQLGYISYKRSLYKRTPSQIRIVHLSRI
ncbi:hypothetical protein [Pedobacter panaciterrae]|uniref:hypothetical protein n=1 Tax=Pedobacter panaciterrae TaxID=363849 RepID=UPI00259369BE|nr:hypothetical protein [uncultured Pedobacter sp.]